MNIQKQKTYFKAILLSCFLVAISACNEDKGNYDYTEINTVKIEETNNDKGLNNRTYSIGDTMRINPILTFSQGEDESNFTFTWYYQRGETWQVLQESRNLEVEVSGPIGKPTSAAPYHLAYEVMNKKTQIPYRKLFDLTVINPLTRGYAVLCEHDADFDIDLIALSSQGKFTLYKDILEMTESELPRKGVKPYDIVTFTDPMAPDPYNKEGVEYSVYVLTDQYTTRIKAADYSWMPSYDIAGTIERNSYLDKEYTQKGKKVVARQMKFIYAIVNGVQKTRSYIYHEDNGQGNWYLCTAWPVWNFYSVQMNSLRSSGNARYEPAPFIATGSSGTMFYDVDKKAFMYGNLPSSPAHETDQWYYTQALPENEAQGAFNFNDPNSGLLYMGEQPGANYPDAGYAISKQTDGSFKYIEFGSQNTVANMITNANKRRVSLFPAGSNIAGAKFFAKAPGANNPFLFYVTGDNRIYKADVSSATAITQDITSTILTNDGYSEITLFKYTLPNTQELGGINNTLAIGSYNPSMGKATGGKLEFFRMKDSATGDLILSKYPAGDPAADGYQIDMSWTGLGKIAGLSYKQM